MAADGSTHLVYCVYRVQVAAEECQGRRLPDDGRTRGGARAANPRGAQRRDQGRTCNEQHNNPTIIPQRVVVMLSSAHMDPSGNPSNPSDDSSNGSGSRPIWTPAATLAAAAAAMPWAHVRCTSRCTRMGVHRTCRRADEVEKAAAHALFERTCALLPRASLPSLP